MKLKSALKVTLLFAACAISPANAGEMEREGLKPVLSAHPQATPPARTSSNASLAAIVDREAAAHGVPTAIARAVVRIESGWNPRTTGRAGEVGLMQIKHGTARAMGYSGSRDALYDPATNIRFGMKYLAEAYRLSGGDLCSTVAKYQGGLRASARSAMARKYCAQARNFIASN